MTIIITKIKKKTSPTESVYNLCLSSIFIHNLKERKKERKKEKEERERERERERDQIHPCLH